MTANIFPRILLRNLRLLLTCLTALAILFSGGEDLSAKRKRSRKARTTKVSKKKKTKKRSKRKSQPALPVVVLGSTGAIDAPEPFVTLPMVKSAPEGLDGRTIALWPSHGKYYAGSWQWQRPRLFGTVEDMLSRSFVDSYITPMLENAGAYVMLPRERDFSHTALIVDNDWSSADGKFRTVTGRHKYEATADSTGFGHRGSYLVQGENPFLMGSSGTVRTVEPDDSARQTLAQWYGTAPEGPGQRAVYVSYQSYPNSATDATYIIHHLGGDSRVTVNQRMGGGTWVYLGSYNFPEKSDGRPLVELTNISDDEDAVVSADAVRIGGGMGTVARSRGGSSPRTSGYPAFLEGARYYLQAAGFPEEVYSVNRGENDYIDDYTSRAHWVNWLTGGSDMLPDSVGLGVPVDMALAFHTDAGIRTDSTVVGTLGLYSTDSGNPLGNGSSRYANRDLSQYVTSQVINDIRRNYNPAWTSRGNHDKRYYEVRATKVPAMIIELLSHQNFEDMKHALDPSFRFLVGRAVYKGILRFLAERYDQPYIVQPLPVNSFAISAAGKGYYNLTWQPTPDPLEQTANPDYYIVYEATAPQSFRPVAVTTIPSWATQINDDDIHAYYIVAGNNGGVSFPSETLALYDNHHRMPSVEIVNGFTRVAPTEWFDGADSAGFDFANRYGVPDGADIHFIGNQFDFNPQSKLGGSSMGFGESSDTEATKPRLGNTHDYPLIHGKSLRAAGRGFVSSSLKAFEQGTSQYPMVDLILGQQKTTRCAGSRERYYQPFPAELRTRLERYLERGGTLLVSGSYLASEIWEADSLTRQAVGDFTSRSLGYKPYIVSDTLARVPVATSSMKVQGVDTPRGLPVVRSSSLVSIRTGMNVGAGNPQSIVPADSSRSTIIARYADTNFPAAIATDVSGQVNTLGGKPGRTVVASFPFEDMEDSGARDRLMETAALWLIGTEPPAVEESTGDKTPAAAADSTKSKKTKKKKADKKPKKKTDKKAAKKEPAKAPAPKKAAPVKDGKAAVPKPASKRDPESPRAVPHPRRH